MILIQLKEKGVLCVVPPHPTFADNTIRSAVAELEIMPRHNEAIAKALGHGPERRKPHGGYGLKFLRRRKAKDCQANLTRARDQLVEDDDSNNVTFSAYSALNLLIWWCDFYPDAVFSVT
jgi:hypothetical protein